MPGIIQSLRMMSTSLSRTKPSASSPHSASNTA